ncbi:MAG TPA: hypothetical protein DF383_00995, partial [Deltaproteobacteria bacterium]|nr:hypothetical protein [Deltaproteobacteria bacterium]
MLTVAIAYSLLEVGVYFLFKYGMLRGDIPSFSISNIGGRFWQEIKFGAWHRPHSVFRHKKSCFDVEYHSNGEGMRDPERPRHSRQSRTVMLGDSFVEGWGLPEGKRISDLLEQATGREFLNFGTSGYVGQTHAYLLYKNLVKNFSHDEVLLGILPSNDFSDDDYEANKDKGRYIIFWKGEYPDYQLAYSAGPRNGVALSRYLYGSLREFSYTYNAVKYQF